MTKTSEVIIAQRYAAALHSMVLANGTVLQTEQELSVFAQTVHNTPAWVQLTQAPTTIAVKIVAKLAVSLKMSDAMRRFLGVLAKRHRLNLLLVVAKQFTQQMRTTQKVGSATVVTAAPLTTTQRAHLTQLLAQNTGLDIALHEQLDPTLLAGFSVHYMGRTVDLSLRQQLVRNQVGIKGNA